jgi:hypothetical protein
MDMMLSSVLARCVHILLVFVSTLNCLVNIIDNLYALYNSGPRRVLLGYFQLSIYQSITRSFRD